MWSGLVLIAMLLQKGIVWDDPYILMRYAENLVTGHGWTLNITEQTDNAVTSPLMVVLLALLRLVRLPMFYASAFLHFILTVTAAHFTWRTLRVAGCTYGAAAGATFVSTSSAFTMMWGMETSLYLALLSIILALGGLAGRMRLVCLAVGLLGLVRPEALLIGAICFLCVASFDDLRALRPKDLAVLGGLVTLPTMIWTALLRIMTGTFLPSTLAAKRAQAKSGWFERFASMADIRGLWPWNLRGQLAPATQLGVTEVRVMISLVVLGLAAAILMPRHRRVGLLAVVPAVVVVVLYRYVLEMPTYPWYWSLPIYGATICGAIGFEWIIRLTPWPKLRLTLATSVTLLIALVGLTGTADANQSPRVQYDEIGRWLDANSERTQTVAYFEIGRLSWASNRTIVDPLGLLDSRLITFVRKGDLTSWLSATQPDYWVLSRSAIDAPLRASPCLALSFREVFSTANYSVYARVAEIPGEGVCSIHDKSSRTGRDSTG